MIDSATSYASMKQTVDKMKEASYILFRFISADKRQELYAQIAQMEQDIKEFENRVHNIFWAEWYKTHPDCKPLQEVVANRIL